jgi:hypothetical protein
MDTGDMAQTLGDPSSLVDQLRNSLSTANFDAFGSLSVGVYNVPPHRSSGTTVISR